MGFQLQAGEPLIDGIRRIALERIDTALEQLSNPSLDRDKAVHDARKTCKRLRAILRFIRDEVGYTYYRRENFRFRDASRLLAPARDSAVLLETLDSLVERFHTIEVNPLIHEIDPQIADMLPVSPGIFADLREKLIERHHLHSKQVLQTDAIPQYIATVREARLNVVDWPMQQVEFTAVSSGLRRVYRQGRQHMFHASQTMSTKALHEWRKCVKYLWYQLELLQPVQPGMLSASVEALAALSGHLGNEHDLAELQQLIFADPTLLPDELRQQLCVMIAHRRKEYQALAWPLGSHLYAEKSWPFVNRIHAYWKIWRAENPIRATAPLLNQTRQQVLPQGLLTTRQTSEALGISPENVRRLIRNGRLPAFKFGQIWLIVGQGEKSSAQMVSTRQAAAQLGLNTRDVRKLIHTGHLSAAKVGINWVINASTLRQQQIKLIKES